MDYAAALSWLVAYVALGAVAAKPYVGVRRRLSSGAALGLTLAALPAAAGAYWLGLTRLAWPAMLAALAVVAVCVAAAQLTAAGYGWTRYALRAVVGVALAAAVALHFGAWPDVAAAAYFRRMEAHEVAVWWTAFVSLGALALPLAALVFDRFDDRGAGVALPLALAVVGVVGYWVGHITFGPVALAAGLAAVAAGTGIAVQRGVPVDLRAYGEVVVVFSLAFGLLVALRGVDPAVTPGAGEKFLDYGLLRSLLRAEALPPADMWFAGEPVQYYYGGHMLAALLTELTGTPARYAYNLALAGVYGTLAAAAYGVAKAVAADRGGTGRTAGAFAAVLVAVASNLSTPLRLLVYYLPEWAGSRIADLASLEIAQRPSVAAGPDSFYYWPASRVIDRHVSGGQQWHYITEFPFFAFRNGDLHAHMVSMPFLLLVAALLFQYWLTPADERRRRRALVFLTVPAVGGLVGVINTWTFPTVAGLTWLALTFAPADPATLFPRRVRVAAERFGDRSRLHAEAARTGTALVGGATVAALGVLLAAPFFLGTASGRSVGVLPPNRSGAAGLLVVHGAFLAVAFAYLFSRDGVPRAAPGLVAVAAVALYVVAAPFRFAAVAIFVPPLVVAWLLLRAGRGVGFETALLVGVLGLVTAVEFVYVVERAGPGRMNTLFKVYTQVWVLWGVAAAVMLADRAPLGAALRAAWGRAGTAFTPVERALGLDAAGDDGRPSRRARTVSVSAGGAVASVAAVGLLASLSLYGGFVATSQFENGTDDPTLDATAYVAEQHPVEAEAIAWLDRREGQPHIVSAPGTEIYDWVNAPSSLTGLPTVAGWNHEVGYRGPKPYYERVADVETIYTGSTEERAALLRQYEVTYIYMGPTERLRYGARDLDDDPGISVEKEYPFVVIFRVDRSELA
ncbi:DUF2298 domain-containing protein [Halostella litorea]|uniref:DUF2298 domain-containing protein n=1 Tax=Halostella litorea TaxID=2528831 RepID=UPI001F22B0BC|nr:DUF2298 domain-containing protein [Halostella litorea]